VTISADAILGTAVVLGFALILLAGDVLGWLFRTHQETDR
jgi:hypothetical protein